MNPIAKTIILFSILSTLSSPTLSKEQRLAGNDKAPKNNKVVAQGTKTKWYNSLIVLQTIPVFAGIKSFRFVNQRLLRWCV